MRSSARGIGSRERSRSSWRARTARFSSRSVRTRSATARRYFQRARDPRRVRRGVRRRVICTPGQDTALTIRNTLAGGRSGGIATAGGVSAGQAVWTIAASAGIVALLSASEPVFRAIKLAGAAYLVYLGLQSLVAAVRGHEHSPTRPGRERHDSRDARVSPGSPQQPRPKMAVFFASLLPSSRRRGARRSSRCSHWAFCSAR